RVTRIPHQAKPVRRIMWWSLPRQFADGSADTAKAWRRYRPVDSGAGFATHTQLQNPASAGFFRDGCERSPARAVSEIGDGLGDFTRSPQQMAELLCSWRT